MSRRWRYPRPRRGQILSLPPVAASPPGYRDQPGARPRFAARLRRGSIFTVPAQASLPPAYRTRDRFSLPARRGRFWVFVPAPVIVAPPRPPDGIGHDRPRLLRPSRGHFAAVLQPSALPVVAGRARSRWLPIARRGRFLAVPPAAPVAPTAPTWVLPILSAHRPRLTAARRGRFTAFPTGAECPPLAAAPPRRRSPRPSRGRFFAVVTTPLLVPPPRAPDRIGYDRPRLVRPPRAHSWVAPAPDTAPAPYRNQRRWVLRPRRGAFLAFVPAPVAVPSARPPDSIGHDRARLSSTRRARFTAVPLPPAQPTSQPQIRVRWLSTPRRGRFLLAPVSPALPAAPVFVPPTIARRRLTSSIFRRGRLLSLPSAPAVTVTPPYVSAAGPRRRPSAGVPRRGRFLHAPSGPAWVPQITTPRRSVLRPVRRAHFTACPTPPQTPSAGLRRRPPSGFAARHGRRFDPPWTAGPTRAPNRITGRHTAPPPARQRRYAEPPWRVARPLVPPPICTRRRIVTTRRGYFWRWSIFQADPPPLAQTDPTATETHLDRRTAAEATTGRVHALESAAGHRIAAEAPVGRLSAHETTLGRDDA